MSVEIIYPNDDDPRDKQPDIFVEVNAYLEAKTKPGEELPRVTQYLLCMQHLRLLCTSRRVEKM
jgi:hypothetical protein